MKYFMILFFSLMLYSAQAQLLKAITKKTASIHINIKDSSGTNINGYLTGFTDSSIILSALELPVDNSKNNIGNDFFTIHYKNLIEVGIRKKNNTLKKMVKTGIITAAITGAILYLAVIFRASPGDIGGDIAYVTPGIFLISSFTGSLAACIAGGVSATSSNIDNYVILGVKDNFDNMKKQILIGINPNYHQ
jgi:archaellum component FlaG (FlaF/FlaG flagellin family)